MKALEYLRQIFEVRKCVSCREILDRNNFDNALCPSCRLAFDVAKTQSCPKCLRAACECTCQPDMLFRAGSLCLRKLFFYNANKDNEPQNRLVYFMKRNPNKRAFGFCADQLWNIISQEMYALGIKDIGNQIFVVNVPRRRKSVVQYGFDQSKEICKKLFEIKNVPYYEALLRKMGGKEQKKLTATERKNNIKGQIYPNEKMAKMLEGKYAVLIDDVVTTGASMSICILALKKLGVKGVICCSLAADLNNKRSR